MFSFLCQTETRLQRRAPYTRSLVAVTPEEKSTYNIE